MVEEETFHADLLYLIEIIFNVNHQQLFCAAVVNVAQVST